MATSIESAGAPFGAIPRFNEIQVLPMVKAAQFTGDMAVASTPAWRIGKGGDGIGTALLEGVTDAANQYTKRKTAEEKFAWEQQKEQGRRDTEAARYTELAGGRTDTLAETKRHHEALERQKDAKDGVGVKLQGEYSDEGAGVPEGQTGVAGVGALIPSIAPASTQPSTEKPLTGEPNLAAPENIKAADAAALPPLPKPAPKAAAPVTEVVSSVGAKPVSGPADLPPEDKKEVEEGMALHPSAPKIETDPYAGLPPHLVNMLKRKPMAELPPETLKGISDFWSRYNKQAANPGGLSPAAGQRFADEFNRRFPEAPYILEATEHGPTKGTSPYSLVRQVDLHKDMVNASKEGYGEQLKVIKTNQVNWEKAARGFESQKDVQAIPERMIAVNRILDAQAESREGGGATALNITDQDLKDQYIRFATGKPPNVAQYVAVGQGSRGIAEDLLKRINARTVGGDLTPKDRQTIVDVMLRGWNSDIEPLNRQIESLQKTTKGIKGFPSEAIPEKLPEIGIKTELETREREVKKELADVFGKYKAASPDARPALVKQIEAIKTNLIGIGDKIDQSKGGVYDRDFRARKQWGLRRAQLLSGDLTPAISELQVRPQGQE